nr:rhamnulokinase [Propionibacteriales bacterium]
MLELSAAAVDLGASSGRVMLARVGPDRLDLREVHRFTNRPATVSGTLTWDILAIYLGVLDGLTAAGRLDPQVSSIGIDSWAVDYGLLDATGTLLGNPVHYRDSRTDGVMEKVAADFGPARLYASTGLQQLPFNTLYQVASARGTTALEHARSLLLIPDLLAVWLTGVRRCELTNASTTQMLDVRTKTWVPELLDLVGLDATLLPELIEPGEIVGSLLPEVRRMTGLSEAAQVVAVAS